MAGHEPQVFLFLSEILGKMVIGPSDETLGNVYDVIAEIIEPYPVVTGIVFRAVRKKIFWYYLGGMF